MEVVGRLSRWMSTLGREANRMKRQMGEQEANRMRQVGEADSRLSASPVD